MGLSLPGHSWPIPHPFPLLHSDIATLEADFDATSTAAAELKKTILDLDNSFWPLMPQFVELMQPLRLAIHTLQGYHAKLSDVMSAWVRMHNSLSLQLASAIFGHYGKAV